MSAETPYTTFEKPLVSVIALCYNHKDFVKEALESVWNQTYSNIELIVVDDASTDGSGTYIRNLLSLKTAVHFIQHQTNQGNCRSFNEALVLAKGKYIIDLATDDVLLPNRIANQVAVFEKADAIVAVCFTNATCVDANGNFLRHHYPVNSLDKSKVSVPSGWVFKNLLERHFLCPPTLMFRAEVLKQLGGYDESLRYEDFDVWLRISRRYQFVYLDEITTLRRELPHSLGRQFYVKNNLLTGDTCTILERVCSQINHTEEKSAFLTRLWYEMKVAIWTEDRAVVKRYVALVTKLNITKIPWSVAGWRFLLNIRFPLYFFFSLYKGRR